MIRLALTAAAAGLALTACGSNAAPADVYMRTDRCDVTPAVLSAGPVDFTVRNDTKTAARFSVMENGDEQVGSVDVAPGATQHLTVEFDHGDEYMTACGTVAGRSYKP